MVHVVQSFMVVRSHNAKFWGWFKIASKGNHMYKGKTDTTLYTSLLVSFQSSMPSVRATLWWQSEIYKFTGLGGLEERPECSEPWWEGSSWRPKPEVIFGVVLASGTQLFSPHLTLPCYSVLAVDRVKVNLRWDSNPQPLNHIANAFIEVQCATHYATEPPITIYLEVSFLISFIFSISFLQRGQQKVKCIGRGMLQPPPPSKT